MDAATLIESARYFRDEMSDAWGAASTWLTTGERVAALVADVLEDMAAQELHASNGPEET